MLLEVDAAAVGEPAAVPVVDAAAVGRKGAAPADSEATARGTRTEAGCMIVVAPADG